MSWIKKSPGHWKRELGENESMIKMIGDGGQMAGKDVWSIAVTALFTANLETSKPLVQVLKDGWRALRFHHPSIATTATIDSINYFVPHSDELEQWVDETFVVLDGEEESLSHVISNLTPRRYATCYYLQKQGGIVLHLSHWRTDGIGAFHLVGAFFAAAAEHASCGDPLELDWVHETSRLVPSVEEVLDLPRTPTEPIQQATNVYLETLSNNKGALGVPSTHPDSEDDGKAPQKGTRAVDLHLIKTQTAQMLTACIRFGIHIESAVHASVTAAAYAIAEPTSRHKHHSSTLRHSLRPNLPTPYDGVPGAAGLFTAGYVVKVPASNSWLENARHYESEYDKRATPDLLCSRRQYAVVMKGILANVVPPNPPPSGLDMSWIPDAESLVRRKYSNGAQILEIQEIGIGVDVLSRHIYVFGWIFGGQLSLRLVCNGIFYGEDFAENVLERVKDSLILNLLP